MSSQENDKIKEIAFEDFEDLYWASSSFQQLIRPIASDVYDLDMSMDAILEQVFGRLWDHDCELLVSDKRLAVEAFLMYKKIKKEINNLLTV